MTRADQYRQFLRMVISLLTYSVSCNIRIRFGEAQRPQNIADANAAKGTGIKDSKHIYSLAIDLWITDEGGKKIPWESYNNEYKLLADFWVSIGGTAGYYFKKKDKYHFEYKGRPL